MITSQTFRTRTTMPMARTSAAHHNSTELSRVFAAAVINQQFCEALLRNPCEALRNGYLGEAFALSKEEQDSIVSSRANNLADLAKQVNRSLSLQY
jgi:hypothetical protein